MKIIVQFLLKYNNFHFRCCIQTIIITKYKPQICYLIIHVQCMVINLIFKMYLDFVIFAYNVVNFTDVQHQIIYICPLKQRINDRLK